MAGPTAPSRGCGQTADGEGAAVPGGRTATPALRTASTAVGLNITARFTQRWGRASQAQAQTQAITPNVM